MPGGCDQVNWQNNFHLARHTIVVIFSPRLRCQVGGLTMRVRSGTGGKELGPVLQEAQGAIVFIGGGNE